MSRKLPSQTHVVLRVAAALAGGYGFTWGFAALAIAALFAAGTSLEDAQSLAAMSGFLIFTAAFLWAFAAGSLARVWLVLAGGGAVMAAAASWIQTALVG